MKRFFTVAALFLAVASLSVAAVTLITATATPAVAGGCLCPQIYAPVICDGGKIYPNQCEADCHHAKNCVPYGV
jgi:hypothetical protein